MFNTDNSITMSTTKIFRGHSLVINLLIHPMTWYLYRLFNFTCSVNFYLLTLVYKHVYKYVHTFTYKIKTWYLNPWVSSIYNSIDILIKGRPLLVRTLFVSELNPVHIRTSPSTVVYKCLERSSGCKLSFVQPF